MSRRASVAVIFALAVPTMAGSALSPTPSPKPALTVKSTPVVRKSSRVDNTALRSTNSSGALAIVQGPGGTLNCRVSVKGAKGDTACTRAQVKALAAVLSTSKEFTTKGYETLTLAQDGTTLLCGATPCTTKHLTTLSNAAKFYRVDNTARSPSNTY